MNISLKNDHSASDWQHRASLYDDKKYGSIQKAAIPHADPLYCDQHMHELKEAKITSEVFSWIGMIQRGKQMIFFSTVYPPTQIKPWSKPCRVSWIPRGLRRRRRFQQTWLYSQTQECKEGTRAKTQKAYIQNLIHRRQFKLWKKMVDPGSLLGEYKRDIDLNQWRHTIL